MFGIGEEEEYEQQPRKSLFSRIGDFLLKGLSILAIIALAIVTIVTLNDTARDKLNDLTKDKDGKGGWGDGIRKGMGLAQEKAGNMVTSAKEYLAETFPSVAKSLAETKQQAVETANTAENVVLGGSAALVAKGLYNKYGDHVQGTVNEAGSFEPLSKKENKAVKEAEKLKTQQEALKAQREAALEKSREARAQAKKANEALKSAKAEMAKMTPEEKFKNPLKTTKAAMALKTATEAEQKAEQTLEKAQKELKSIRTKIQKTNAALAKAEKIIPDNVITRGEYKAKNAPAVETAGAAKQTTAHPSPSASSKEPVGRPSGQVTVESADKKTIVDITDRQHSGGTGKAPASNTSSANHMNSTSLLEKAKGFIGRFPLIGRVMRYAPPTIVAAATVPAAVSEAYTSLENGNHGDAAATTIKTAATIAAPVIPIANEGLTALARTDAVKGGEKAYVESKLAGLSDEQKAAVAAWKKDAETRGLDISRLEIMDYIQKHAPKTPNTLLSNNGQTQSPAKGN